MKAEWWLTLQIGTVADIKLVSLAGFRQNPHATAVKRQHEPQSGSFAIY